MAVISESDDGTKQQIKEEIERISPMISDELKARIEAVWTAIYNDAIAECPVDTGTLVSTIKMVGGDESLDNVSGAEAGGIDESGGGIKAYTVYDSTITAGDETIINRKTNQPCIYAQWVHDGHVSRDGHWVAGVPFLEDAIARHIDELDEIEQEIADAIGAE